VKCWVKCSELGAGDGARAGARARDGDGDEAGERY